MPISKHDKQGLADLFISMGVPLVIAMQTVESWSGADADTPQKRAETLSKLLTISVEFATKITKKMDIRDTYTLENVRGKIIKIVTPIVADYYVTTGQLPESDKLSEIVNLFDVLISFAETVSPTDEKVSKQVKIASMIEACDPLINAIRENNFGSVEAKLFQECVAGLIGRSQQLSKAYGMDENGIENGIFKSILKIYVSCYQKIASSNGEYSSIWAECDERIALLYGLTAYVGEKTGTIIDLDKNPPAQDTPQLQNDTKLDNLTKKKQEKIVKSETEEKKDDAEDDNGDDFNPMAFFSTDK
jgi:hypothetical protein